MPWQLDKGTLSASCDGCKAEKVRTISEGLKERSPVVTNSQSVRVRETSIRSTLPLTVVAGNFAAPEKAISDSILAFLRRGQSSD